MINSVVGTLGQFLFVLFARVNLQKKWPKDVKKSLLRARIALITGKTGVRKDKIGAI